MVLKSSIYVRNTLEEINDSKGKIELCLIRIWGNDDREDENYFFKFPGDVKIGKDDLVYISDTGNHLIKVFDRNCMHKKNIGRKGQGPADLLEPGEISFDSKGNLLVADYGNYRIQAFDTNGNYLFSFKTVNANPSQLCISQNNEIAIYAYKKTFFTGTLVTFYDPKGNIIKEIGKIYKKSKFIIDSESVYFRLDKKDNVIAAYHNTPFYWIYAPDGSLKTIVSFDMPNKKVVLEPGKTNEYKLQGKINSQATVSLSVDEKNHVYLVTTTRPPKEDEQFFLVGSQGSMKRFPKIISSEKTDRYQLLVFNPHWKVIASKKLNVFCDKIYVHNDTLFIIDSYMGMKIYEYKISFF
jgi:hypothetical protein